MTASSTGKTNQTSKGEKVASKCRQRNLGSADMCIVPDRQIDSDYIVPDRQILAFVLM